MVRDNFSSKKEHNQALKRFLSSLGKTHGPVLSKSIDSLNIGDLSTIVHEIKEDTEMIGAGLLNQACLDLLQYLSTTWAVKTKVDNSIIRDHYSKIMTEVLILQKHILFNSCDDLEPYEFRLPKNFALNDDNCVEYLLDEKFEIGEFNIRATACQSDSEEASEYTEISTPGLKNEFLKEKERAPKLTDSQSTTGSIALRREESKDENETTEVEKTRPLYDFRFVISNNLTLGYFLALYVRYLSL